MKDILDFTENKLFWTTSDTELADFCREVFFIAEKYPEISASIVKDQDTLGMRKKTLRMRDKIYQADKTENLPGIESSETQPVVKHLSGGRPRMKPDLVLLFFCLRGYFGSVTDRQFRNRAKDSVTLNILFSNLGMKFPGFTTILENVNSLSPDTIDLIHRCYIHEIMNENLDDFRDITVDSTSVSASSEWPTDARIICRMLERVFLFGRKLENFGIKNIQEFYFPAWMNELKRLLFKINTVKGTKKQPKAEKLQKLYDNYLVTAHKAYEYLVRNFETRSARMKLLDLSPSFREKLEKVHKVMEDDLLALSSVLYYSEERVFNGVELKSTEKILSLSDTAAAFIKKGDRNVVIGYKPQLAMSSNGFVSALVLEEGNVSDSKSLMPLVRKHMATSGVLPKSVSADDGYSSTPGYEAVLEIGVEKLSLSGAVGKKITPVELWEDESYIEMRKQRSAVESLMFTLKYVFEFGRMRRRGLKNVRSEMMGKLIAYNMVKALRIRATSSEAYLKAG
jgi:hypothetical protein